MMYRRNVRFLTSCILSAVLLVQPVCAAEEGGGYSIVNENQDLNSADLIGEVVSEPEDVEDSEETGGSEDYIEGPDNGEESIADELSNDTGNLSDSVSHGEESENEEAEDNLGENGESVKPSSDDEIVDELADEELDASEPEAVADLDDEALDIESEGNELAQDEEGTSAEQELPTEEADSTEEPEVLEEDIELDVAAAGITAYEYSVQPILDPFPYYIYVATDNPDPNSFCFVDKNTCYAGDEYTESIYVVSETVFADVLYENESTGRVQGGYIFECTGAVSDGGTLTLATWDRYEYTATKKTVSINQMKDDVDYLIDKYAVSGTIFDKLDAIQGALLDIAVYPKRLLDKSRPNVEYPYPFYAISPYWELGLSARCSMFLPFPGGYLLRDAYPFVLDSLSFPGILAMCAEKLNPNVEVNQGAVHYLIDVSLGGETRSYGYAGAGSGDPLYVDRLSKYYTFDGAASDYAMNGSISAYVSKHLELNSFSVADADEYLGVLTGSEFKEKVGKGSWVKVVSAGVTDSKTAYAYMLPGPDGNLTWVSDCWVDGRYVGINEAYVNGGVTFDEHPTAEIVVPNVTYTDQKGKTHQQDVCFEYDGEHDQWHAAYYYTGQYMYSDRDYEKLPDNLIITREEVNAMDLDRNSAYAPSSGVICDGTAEPGTPFTGISVTGISFLEAEVTIGLEEYADLSEVITVEPENASDKTVYFETEDESIIAVHDWYGPYGNKEGSTRVTAITRDGSYRATVTVHVVHLTDPTINLQATSDGIKVTWNHISGTKKYRVIRESGGYGDDYEYKNLGIVEGISFLDKTAKQETLYKYSVTCVSDQGYSLSYGSNGSYIYYEKPIEVKKVTLDKEDLSLTVGATQTLYAIVSPDDATYPEVTWKSSNKSVAKVNSKGKITAIAPGKATITATSADGKKSAVCSVKVIPVKMATPTLKNVATGVKISWTKADDISGYLIYRKMGSGSWKRIQKITKASTLTYTDQEATTGKTKYTYRIRSYKEVNGSNYAGVYSANVYTYYMPKMKISKVTNYGYGIKATWKSTPATGYALYRKIGTGSWKHIKSLSASSFKDLDANVNGTKYSYRIRAYYSINNKNYYGAYSDVRASWYLAKQRITSAKSTKARKLKVAWTKNTMADGYEVEYSTATNFGDARKNEITKNSTVSKTVGSLTSGRVYYVRVRSYKSVDGTKYYSAWSEVRSTTVK